MQSLTLSTSEIQVITGYKQPAKQEAELRRQGFYRVRRSERLGHIILERSHYESVCAGGTAVANTPEPKLKKRA